MKYKVYSVQESTQVLTVEAEALEIGCDCGATWLHDHLAGWLHPCPYCGADDLNFGSEALAEQSARGSSYGRDLRGVCRQLWAGTIDEFQAYQLLQDTIRIGLTRAWHEGAAECSISPAELSPEERRALDEAIYNESGHIDGLISFVTQNNKASGTKLAVVLARVELWTLRYSDVVNRAKIMACGDKKLAWRLGPTAEHCVDCAAFDSKVKRASQWAAAGIRPQSQDLACHGFRCLCYFEQTDEPMSKGPLPRMRGA